MNEALSKVKEALEMISTTRDGVCDNGYSPEYVAREALAALSHLQQGPVAYRFKDMSGTVHYCAVVPGFAQSEITPLYTHPLAVADEVDSASGRVAQDISEMVNRFLGWKLPSDFCPDCGISFDGRKDDEWNKNKTWPTGTNIFSADQARAMFEFCLRSDRKDGGS